MSILYMCINKYTYMSIYMHTWVVACVYVSCVLQRTHESKRDDKRLLRPRGGLYFTRIFIARETNAGIMNILFAIVHQNFVH